VLYKAYAAPALAEHLFQLQVINQLLIKVNIFCKPMKKLTCFSRLDEMKNRTDQPDENHEMA